MRRSAVGSIIGGAAVGRRGEWEEATTEHEPWYLPVGERLAPERAAAVVVRFGAEARAVGERVAARLRAERPGRQVRGRVYGVRLVLEAFQVERGPTAWGIWIGDVTYPHEAGGRTASVGIVLEWETGRVRAVE